MTNIQAFTCTSLEPYDRHMYEMELTNGDKHIFDSYQEAQAFWFHRCELGYLKCVNVLDRTKKTKKTSTKPKGF